MNHVHASLEEAVELVEKLKSDAEKVMDKAHLSERLIQHGNRYRSKHPLLAAKLLEAEEKFRSYEYDQALALAAEAVKEVDPRALEKMEAEEEMLV